MTREDATVAECPDPNRIDPPPELMICSACTWIYGPWQDEAVTRIQSCHCRNDVKQEIWPRFDFNLHASAGAAVGFCARALTGSR